MLGGTSIIKGQDFFVAGPVLGAPMAVMALEVLVGGGAQKILFAGFGGSLSPELEPGDFLAPGSAIAGEGTSAHYEGGRLAPDPELLKSVEKALLRRELLRGGPIWSTDGPLRETAERRAAYRALGAVAVDMEVSALFAAASFREVALAALILLTDSFGQGPWREGFKLPKFKKNLSLCGEIAWEALQG
jgi:uridine phosphorylase